MNMNILMRRLSKNTSVLSVKHQLMMVMAELAKAQGDHSANKLAGVGQYHEYQSRGINSKLCYEWFCADTAEDKLANAFILLTMLCKHLQINFAINFYNVDATDYAATKKRSFQDNLFDCMQKLSSYDTSMSRREVKALVLTSMLNVLSLAKDEQIKLMWFVVRKVELNNILIHEKRNRHAAY